MDAGFSFPKLPKPKALAAAPSKLPQTSVRGDDALWAGQAAPALARPLS